MPAAVAIPAIVGAVGIGANVATGVMGSHAAKNAAQIQSEAAARAGQQVVDTANNVNPQITAAAGTAGADVSKAAGDAGAGFWSATDRANAGLDPYAAAGSDATGTLRTLLAPGGDLNRTFTADDFKSLDPGFDFRLKQEQIALDRSAAAHGGSMGGGAAKELTRYSQDYGSNEFQNAFTRFEQQGNDRFTRLSDIAKLGYSAAGQQGSNLTNAGKYSGDLTFNAAQYGGNAGMHAADVTAANSIDAARASGEFQTQGANAQAAGKIGSANAFGNAAAGVSNAVSGAVTLGQLMANPALQQPSTQTLARLPQRAMWNPLYQQVK
jgi:hypothetical protein